jgi:peptide/histidine transporter 3/4
LKHKHPERRSAFTYCEDELPSRLDFGKSKYGGPFTTEQVEDVKIFFGILGMSLSISAVFGMMDEKDFQVYLLRITRTNQVTLSKCMLRFLFTDTYYIAVTLLIPLNEIFIYLQFHRCTPSIKRHWKVYFGTMIQIMRYVLLVMLLTVFEKSHVDTNGVSVNVTSSCTIILQETLDDNVYRVYSSVPELLSAVSYILIIVGITEFLCAQVPYSMKGLMVGIFYGSLELFLVLNKGMLMFNSPSWNFGALFICGFWYLLIKLFFLLIKLFFLLITITISPLVSLCYKKRKRDDVLPNEQIFTERYYSKYSD